MKLDEEWIPYTETSTKDVTDRRSRGVTMINSKIIKSNLSKYISKFKDNEWLVENQYGGYEVSIKPVINNNCIEINIILKW